MAINNLYVKYNRTFGTSLPIIVLMHGWSGDADSFAAATLTRYAGYGFCVVVPGMRGRNDAGGSRDASAREIYDIYDAVEYVRDNYAACVSSTKAAIVGYSGGGGNALAAACKFPDYWNCVVSFFGPSDYGRNNPGGWWYSDPAYQGQIEAAVGDTPSNVPNDYYTRDATAAIPNYSSGNLYLFHDDEDTSVSSVHSERIETAMSNAGLSNYAVSITTALDDPRWQHGYPASQADLIDAEAIFKSAALDNTAWTIAASGTVTVIGYIVTKRFTIWLNTNGTGTLGVDAVATVAYNTATDTYTVTPLTTGGIDVSITQGTKTGSATNISAETEIIVS